MAFDTLHQQHTASTQHDLHWLYACLETLEGTKRGFPLVYSELRTPLLRNLCEEFVHVMKFTLIPFGGSSLVLSPRGTPILESLAMSNYNRKRNTTPW